MEPMVSENVKERVIVLLLSNGVIVDGLIETEDNG